VALLAVTASITTWSYVDQNHAARAANGIPIGCSGRAQLSEFDSTQAMVALRSNKPDVTIEFLAHPTCVSYVLGELRILPATIEFVDRKSGYIELEIAAAHVQEVLDTKGLDAARTLDSSYSLDPAYVLPARRMVGVSSYRVAWPRVATSLAPGQQFFPAGEIGLPALWKNEPEGDGRGVRIALIDQGIDLLHPALHLAKNANGGIVPKLAGIITTNTPQQDGEWVETRAVEAMGGFIDAAGHSWRVPHDGSYRFGILDWHFEPKLEEDKSYALHLNAGVLWDTAKKLVWIDTPGDHDFTKDRVLQDYSIAHHIAWFGKTDRSGDERIPFAVAIDTHHQAIYIDLGNGPHGAFVAGTLAANHLSGGIFDGAAPMAQIIDARSSEEMRPFVMSFASPQVDVINCSCGVARYDEQHFARVVLERLIQVYRKPLICYCEVRGAISVSDYQSPDQTRRNRRASPPYRETINGIEWGSWGHDNPSGIENWLLGPSASLTTQSRYLPFSYPRSNGRVGYDFPKSVDAQTFYPVAPPGYTIGENPSPTITVVSGVVADMVSLARRYHIRYDAIRMSNALFTGSRTVAGFPASVQENGLVNAMGAWHQLAAMSRVDDPINPDLTHFDVLRDPDKTQVDGYFQNIFKPGGDIVGRIWIVRHGGYGGSRMYNLSIRRDGIPGILVFTPLRTNVKFARDIPMLVAFRIYPTAGDHLAYLQLADKRSGTVMQQIPLHVIVPEPLTTTALGVKTFHTFIPPRRSASEYFMLPDNPSAVRIEVSTPYTGSNNPYNSPTNPIAFFGLSYVSNGTWSKSWLKGIRPKGPALDMLHHVGPIDNLRAIDPQPTASWWFVYLQSRGAPEYETQYDPPAPTVPIPVTIAFEEYRVDARREGSILVLRNALAPLKGRIEFFAGPSATPPLSGSETTYVTRKQGEQWRLALPSNVPLSERLYWALHLSPLKTDLKQTGYLTKLKQIP